MSTEIDTIDFTLTEEQLREKYAGPDGGWGEHPVFAFDDWRVEAGLGNTRRGYWNWVQAQLEQARDEDEPIVRYGSDGQPVYYEDEDDASEHFLRMQEGLC